MALCRQVRTAAMARGREREALVALWRLGLALFDRSKPELTPLHVDILQLCVGGMGMGLNYLTWDGDAEIWNRSQPLQTCMPCLQRAALATPPAARC